MSLAMMREICFLFNPSQEGVALAQSADLELRGFISLLSEGILN